MGKGRDKRKRAKEKKSVGGDGGAAVKESGASKTQRKTLQNAEKREQRKINKEDDIDAALAALELETQRHGAGGGSERLLEEMERGPIPARSGFSICVADASAGPPSSCRLPTPVTTSGTAAAAMLRPCSGRRLR